MDKEKSCLQSVQVFCSSLGDFFRRSRQCGTSALIPGSIGWRIKIARTNVNKQNGNSEAQKIIGCCHNFATKVLQEAFWKVGQEKNMVEVMDLLKRKILFETITVVNRHQVKMAFLTTVWSNWFVFLRFRNNFRYSPSSWMVMW